MISPSVILDKISALQSQGNGAYDTGLFPSQRLHSFSFYLREDNNVFFSALIAFTLESLAEAMHPELRSKARRISKAIIANYPKYLHSRNPDTYNFWQNHKNGHFPHGRLFSRISWLALPADTDDTSIIYLTSTKTSDLKKLKRKLETQYPVQAPVSPLTGSHYADLRPYPTFLGRKIIREMDACVISNILLLIFRFQLPLSQIDYDSIEYLQRVLERKDHVNAPFAVSPNYANSSVILYHIARLAGSFDNTELNKLRSLLQHCLELQSPSKLPWMEKLLIKTAMLRMEMPVSPLQRINSYNSHFRQFYFFRAGMLSGFQRKFLKNLSGNPLFHLKYRCEAYYWTLVLEYMLLSGDHNYSRS